MTVTTTDDGFVRTHEDARRLLRYAVPGARVTFEMKTARSCGYEISVRQHGLPDLCVVGSYTLPCLADRIASHARAQVEAGLKR
jgi:NADPH-dependent 2,4-dienoyl-CoA reductase/sulfur reductase-like enzyme